MDSSQNLSMRMRVKKVASRGRACARVSATIAARRLYAGITRAMLAAVEVGEGEVSAEEAEMALWLAGCEVLRDVGDSAGAARCVQLQTLGDVVH
jgi:sporulation-control protein spo0M